MTDRDPSKRKDRFTDDDARILYMKEQMHLNWHEIAECMNMSRSSVQRRFEKCKAMVDRRAAQEMGDGAGAISSVPDGKLTTDMLLGLLDSYTKHFFRYLDDGKLALAPAKDLIQGIKTFRELAQLLQGRPTKIIGQSERRELDELMPLLLEEAQRRGMKVPKPKVIDVQHEEVG